MGDKHGRPQLFWKGGRIGQGGAISQPRVRCPLSADSTSGGGGGAVRFQPIQPVRGEGGGGVAVRFWPIQPQWGGGCVC